MPIVFGANPSPERKMLRVGEATTQFKPFNEVYRASYDYLETNGLDDVGLSRWRKDFREGIINVGGRNPDIQFFEHMVGATTKEINATDYYIEYNGALDFNVYADAAVTGAFGAVTNAYFEKLQNGTYTGNYATFQPITGSYSAQGTENSVYVGMGLYIMQDGEEVVVIKIDTTTPYAWTVTVAPMNGSYIPNIYARTAMAIRPATRTSGYSSTDSVQQNTPWNTTGYIDLVQGCEVDRNWSVPMDLDAGYQDVMQFAILFDNVTQQPIPTWAFKNQLEAHNDVKIASTFAMFVGQKNTNPGLLANVYTNKYNGFDGLMPKLWYGGGNTVTYNNTYGFSIEYDYMNIVFANDAQKKSDELLMLNSLQFQWDFEKRNNDMIKNNPGGLTFQTFDRMGGVDLKQYQIQSFKWADYSIHLRVIGAFSDTRMWGNEWVKNSAIIMPGYGMTDSLGEPVGPIEFYRQKGVPQSAEWDETVINNYTQTEKMARKWTGSVHRRLQMAVHGRENMYSILPEYVS